MSQPMPPHSATRNAWPDANATACCAWNSERFSVRRPLACSFAITLPTSSGERCSSR
jgi:hypothetical protein